MHRHAGDLGSEFRPPGDRVRADEGAAHDVGLDPRDLLGLQRTAGNAAVTGMLEEERSPVHDVISSSGRPLDHDVRADMEARFGQDFSDVRIHTGEQARRSATSVNAQAYTVGSDVVFQHYDPSSDAGRHMLAHELTHVVQQRNGPVDGTEAAGGVRVSDPSDRFEREAAATADHVMSAPAPAVQREETQEEEATAQTYVQRQEEEVEDPELAGG
ncbi:eCIS core domain-containing protein [Planotetraspora kaengkrachanensis]|uniref:eCIS core domain-containing protein n=1 Tax=Planotetraspora kaengkrachanensis TaxID=575193 RepID=A0A8J3PX97_9ACTN|nr:DUF4157 domain-containing protein [Planotetraspora kaengkrachanensis]GIG82685.1 hypothetical protein Pka01_58120 [Planotetraspora kaengkrachanensis]